MVVMSLNSLCPPVLPMSREPLIGVRVVNHVNRGGMPADHGLHQRILVAVQLGILHAS